MSEKRVVVYHNQIPTNGGQTHFVGEDVEAEVTPEGHLAISKWVTTDKTGSALFAAGKWDWFCIDAAKP